MRKKKAVTLKDLSQKSGLSVQTISKALRGQPGMSEESRAQLLKLAQECGYRTKGQEHIHAAEKIPLRPGKPFRFKLIVSDKFERFNMIQLVLGGLQDKFSEYGHSVEIVQIPYQLENGAALPNWAESYQVEYGDGLFIAPMIGEEQEEFLLRYSIPRILINFPGHAAKVDSIAWDVGTAMHQSVRYLLANGHTRIMYVGGISTHRGFIRRWQAFMAAMKEAGLDATPDSHMITESIEKQHWSEAFVQKLLRDQPTAIINANSDIAWIYHACACIGKRIPNDISVIGFEHEQNAFVPELTRPYLLIREAGIRAAERMLWRIANPHLPYEHVLLQGGFYEGATVNKRNRS